ncbi:hypothetical protein [Burkholderia plantarii]|uniref:hypothetical protein n=1 Tax=Burkholderia plantarii TaxID=41899 RepID=UPI0011E06290|nr:hypothetical protein [Burkholderia plantarii]
MRSRIAPGHVDADPHASTMNREQIRIGDAEAIAHRIAAAGASFVSIARAGSPMMRRPSRMIASCRSGSPMKRCGRQRPAPAREPRPPFAAARLAERTGRREAGLGVTPHQTGRDRGQFGQHARPALDVRRGQPACGFTASNAATILANEKRSAGVVPCGDVLREFAALRCAAVRGRDRRTRDPGTA